MQDLVVVGLISVLLGDALQDTFVTYRRELVERGRRVLADNPCGLAACDDATNPQQNEHYQTAY